MDTRREGRHRAAAERNFCSLSVATALFSDNLDATSDGLSTYYYVNSTTSVRTGALDICRRDVPRFITLDELQHFRHIQCGGVDELDLPHCSMAMEVEL